MAMLVHEVETARLLLRGINREDTEKIVAWRSEPDVYQFFKSPHQITKEEHLTWFNNSYLKNNRRFDWMCIEQLTGNRIGVVGAIIGENDAEINYILAPEAQHKGYAKEAIEGIISYLKRKHGVNQVIAEIHKGNYASITLVKRLGFSLASEKEMFQIFELNI